MLDAVWGLPASRSLLVRRRRVMPRRRCSLGWTHKFSAAIELLDDQEAVLGARRLGT